MAVRRNRNITGSALVFVTTTVKDWLPVFAVKSAALKATMQLKETSQACNVSVVGYVIMPTHVHALLGFPDIAGLSTFVQSFKSLTARRIREMVDAEFAGKLIRNGKYQLWMRRFDDVVVYSEQQFRTKLEYMHNNPQKAGLVEQPVDWNYSSARDWLTGEAGLVKVEKDYGWIRTE